MLNLEQIEKYFPFELQPFKRNMLREYLQYKILSIIFDSKYHDKLSFIGGTALRIVHNNTRFSEDLDFDNFGLKENHFEELSRIIQKEMQREGCSTEIRNIFKGAFRCYIKIPDILFKNKISNLKEEKILIQLDTVSKSQNYVPEKKILSKFDVFTQIQVTPLDILLSQKIETVFNRKRLKGRDFYDTVFLFSLGIKPNYTYLNQKISVKNKEQLKKYLLQNCKNVNFENLAKDVEAFLFNPKDKQKIILFPDFIRAI